RQSPSRPLCRLSIEEADEDYSQLGGVEWGLTHGFFANMGGFVLVQSPKEMLDRRSSALDVQAEEVPTGQQNLDEDAIYRSPGLSAGQLHSPGLIEDGCHQYLSTNRREDESVEESFISSPRYLSERISPDTNKINQYVQETELGWLPQYPGPQQLHTLRNHVPLAEVVASSSTVPLLKDNSVIIMKNMSPKLVSRSRFGSSKLDSRDLSQTRQPVQDLGATIWKSHLLREAGAIPYYYVPFHLLAGEIFALRESGALTKLPKSTSAEINDKSKGDTFLKIITSVQVLWFIFQVIIRAIRQLSISQLEVAVTAFGTCAIITYFLILPKPKSVDIPITLQDFQGHIPIYRREFVCLRQRVPQKYIRSLFILGDGLASEVDIMGSHIPNNALNAGWELHVLYFGVSIGGIIFGAIHIAARNIPFYYAHQDLGCHLWRVDVILLARGRVRNDMGF
ncbi:hypothetical protein N431DRAFT_529915, partial [Stipitochalara longipes BDJ]